MCGTTREKASILFPSTASCGARVTIRNRKEDPRRVTTSSVSFSAPPTARNGCRTRTVGRGSGEEASRSVPSSSEIPCDRKPRRAPGSTRYWPTVRSGAPPGSEFEQAAASAEGSPRRQTRLPATGFFLRRPEVSRAAKSTPSTGSKNLFSVRTTRHDRRLAGSEEAAAERCTYLSL